MDIVLTEEDKNRFYSKIIIDPITNCHIFKGCVMKTGYGVLRINEMNFLAHRIAWVLLNGQIENNKFVCHKCDNTSCCNTDHLFLGTHIDNMRDMTNKGRGHRGTKLTDTDVLTIYANKDNYNKYELAKIYNVIPNTIVRIMNKTRHNKLLKII